MNIFSRSGFTIIEILVALFIFMIAILGLIPGLINSIKINKMNEVRDIATTILDYKTKELYEQSYSAFDNISGICVSDIVEKKSITFFYDCDIVESSPDLKKVTLKITYTKPYNNDNITLVSTIYLRKK